MTTIYTSTVRIDSPIKVETTYRFATEAERTLFHSGLPHRLVTVVAVSEDTTHSARGALHHLMTNIEAVL